MSEEKFVDFATVRDLLYEAQDRRGQLTYEQTAALQHAEWAASDARNGSKTDPQVFEDLRNAIKKNFNGRLRCRANSYSSPPTCWC